jgi:xanthine/CO dehydrogenase XdhC/CoxF family maturation factor
MTIAPTPQEVLQFLANHGEAATLVTLVQVTGSASRAVGTQMAVAMDKNLLRIVQWRRQEALS